MADDVQRLTIRELDNGVRKARAAEREPIDARHGRVEPKRGEDVPGRECAAIVVARQAAGAAVEERQLYASDHGLRPGGRRGEVVRPGRIEAWFVAEPGVRAVWAGAHLGEGLVQARDRRPGPAHSRVP